MKYRLAKDLPFAKKGTHVYIADWDMVFIKIEKRKFEDGGSMNLHTNYLGKKKDLLKDGWIEEVKPREFYILHDIEKNIDFPIWFTSKEKAIDSIDIDDLHKKYSIIKFTEVIE